MNPVESVENHGQQADYIHYSPWAGHGNGVGSNTAMYADKSLNET
jgi:hypothetical protein